MKYSKKNPFRFLGIKELLGEVNPLLEDLKVEEVKKEEEKKTEGLPNVECKYLNPEGVIWELQDENKLLRRLLVDKILELERKEDEDE